MKANEAPEKIYFDRESIESIPEDDPLFNCLSIKENDDDIEYTRTDAFVEKACEYLEYKVKIILCGDKTDTDKFIDEFRKYMKV